MPAQLLRQLQHSDIVCPAGTLVGDCSVRCNIEKSTIDGRLNPESVSAFCGGDYLACPSWRLANQLAAEGREVQLEKSPREELLAELAKLNHEQRARLVAHAMRVKNEREAKERAGAKIWTPGPIRGDG